VKFLVPKLISKGAKVTRRRVLLESSWTAVAAIVAAVSVVFAAFALYDTFTSATAGNPRVRPSQANPAVEWTVPSWLNYVLAAAVVAAVALYAFWIYFRIRGAAEERRLAARQFEQERAALENLRERMALPSLVELNRIMLDRYHQIATDQADQSFKSSRRAMAIGYTSLIVAFVAVPLLPGVGTKVAVAGLGAVGATLSGFLSRTYLRVYDRSLDQLNNYFNQPLVNSYYLTAERLIQAYSESSGNELVKEFVRNVLTNAMTFGRDSGQERAGLAPAPGARRGGKPAAKVIDVDRKDKAVADE
jgi:hypothetical protein